MKSNRKRIKLWTLSNSLLERNDYHYFDKESFHKWLSSIEEPKLLKRKNISYYNVPTSFDIETSSFQTSEMKKQAIMYEWSYSYNGVVWYGRYWQEFLDLIDELYRVLDLSLDKRIIIYVHNLSYEFQFMRKHFQWDKVFALKEREVLYACTIEGIEFRCSYLLSGYNLDTLAKNLHRFKIRKLVGDLDYSLLRTPITPLTEEELQYCINDVQIVVAYITELIERDRGITNIQLTKTGYVRKFCRDSCYYGFGKKSKSRIQGVQRANEKTNT